MGFFCCASRARVSFNSVSARPVNCKGTSAMPTTVEADTMRRPTGVTGVMSPNPTVVKVVSPKYKASKKSEICAFEPDSAA